MIQYMNLALEIGNEAGLNFYRRRFPRAVRSDVADNLTGIYLEIDVFQHLLLAVPFVQVRDLDDWRLVIHSSGIFEIAQ
jgi:hypothetical protein